MSKKVAYGAVMIALAMIFSYVEALVPINFGIPGMKLGLANLVTVTGLYLISTPEILAVSMIRILLTGYMFGNGMSLIYSLAGGLLSFLVMAVLKRIKGFSILGVSIAGGVFHNVGQLVVAAWVIHNTSVFYYFPALLVSGAVTGLLIGVLSKGIIRTVKREFGRDLTEDD